MAHTYADTSIFKNYLADNGATDFGTTSDTVMLAILEGSSRRVDAYADRSRFGSGFGPRVAANVYDHDGSSVLRLDDDFITVTSVASAPSTGEAQTTLTVTTDYLTDPTYAPYRRLLFPGLGTNTIGAGLQVFTVNGTAGYATETESLGTMGTVSATSTAGTMLTGTAYPGMTLLNETEQMYVTAATGGTALTLARGANGSTAALHASGNSISRYRYNRSVETATLLVAQRRWRGKEAGVSGDFGGGGVPVSAYRDTEVSVIRATCGHLRIWSAG